MRREDLDEELEPTQEDEEEEDEQDYINSDDDDDEYWDSEEQRFHRWTVASPEQARAFLKRQRENEDRNAPKTAAELRAQYERKLLQQRMEQTLLPVDLETKIWHDILVGLGFKQVMKLIARAFASPDPDARAVGIQISKLLSTQNSVWRHWIEQEMPDFWRDLGMSHDQVVPPIEWLMQSRARVLEQKQDVHEDDALFERVPWRSCYMWLHMFRRQCAKYFADMFIEYQQLRCCDLWRRLNIPFNDERWRSAIQIWEQGGKTIVRLLLVDEEDGNRVEPVVFGLSDVGDYSAYDVLITDAIPYRLFMLYRKTVRQFAEPDDMRPEEGPLGPRDMTGGGRRPNVGQDRGPAHSLRYEYNYDPMAVECFVRWYVSVLIEGRNRPPATPENKELTPFWDTEFEAYFERGNPVPSWRALHSTLTNANLKRGFLEWHEVTLPDGQIERTLRWSWLSRLPLCPRRADRRELDRMGALTWAQFLGAELSQDDGSREGAAFVGYMISHDTEDENTDYVGTALIGTSHAKWLKMAHESTIKGHPETGRQRRYFFAMAAKTAGGGGGGGRRRGHRK